MDQHPSWVVRHERFEPEPHRILPFGAARNRRQQAQAGGCRGENRAVLVADHDLHAIDPLVPGESRDCVAQHGACAERQVLLGHGAAKPGAAAGGDDKGKNRAHCRKLDRGSAELPTAGGDGCRHRFPPVHWYCPISLDQPCSFETPPGGYPG